LANLKSLTAKSDIKSGDFADYILDQKTPGTQSRYVSFIGSQGAICVSWITLKNLDGAHDAAWTGDVGYSCGHSWNWGRQVAGTLPDGSPYTPRCIWIDSDHSNGIDTGAMKIDFEAYGENLKETIQKQTACSKTTFQNSANEVDGTYPTQTSPPKPHVSYFLLMHDVGVPQKKRSMVGTERPEWMAKRLIVSDFPEHNATELCSHPMSYGPDAAGSDGYFCDMQTRELTPLCSFQDVDGCINVDEAGSKITKRSAVAKRSANLHVRSYETVDDYKFAAIE